MMICDGHFPCFTSCFIPTQLPPSTLALANGISPSAPDVFRCAQPRSPGRMWCQSQLVGDTVMSLKLYICNYCYSICVIRIDMSITLYMKDLYTYMNNMNTKPYSSH